MVVFSDGSEVEVQYSDVTVQPGGKGIVITAPLPTKSANLKAAAAAGQAAPIATRYGYAPWPVTSLYTADGWPAIPWNRKI